jgi:hypothetical protein
MARPGSVYPQVDPRAGGIMDIRVVECPVALSVGEALQLARRRGAGAIVESEREEARERASQKRHLIAVAHLERTAARGLGSIAARRLAMPVPVVDARTSEVIVRRRLLRGTPAVLVTDHGRVVGAVGGAVVQGEIPTGVSLARPLETRLPAEGFALAIGFARRAEGRGRRAFLVGDLVRDTVLEWAAPQSRAVGAVVAGPDTVTAPELLEISAGAQSLLAVLGRRGFTIDAMAIDLSSCAFGLVDPFGGRFDAARRRLRVVHPLAFLEDPELGTRAARYAAVGFTLDSAARCARALRCRPRGKDD